MNKINIIGTTGTGKTTFGRALADKLGYPFIELDRLYWLDDWQETSDEDFFAKITQFTNQPKWVLDGNYSRSTAVKWRDVDTVIWLNYPFSVVLVRAIKRAMKRVITQEKLWDTNNIETLGTLFSRDSIVLWTMRTYWKNRHKYREIKSHPDYAHIDFIELNSPRKAERFLNDLMS